ncbi:MAG: hypothetical protein J7641_06480 [Cyanobacteria bacterium SID2]|nr:hypothetical protein [Cyanobacteria bacterium SID2]
MSTTTYLNRSIVAGALALGSILTVVAGCVFGIPLLMVLLNAAVPYPVYLQCLIQGKYRYAFGWVLFWAICHSVAVGFATVIAPATTDTVIISGTRYTSEMLHWIQTGEGAEGSLRLFLPIHLKQYAIFSILSIFSLGSAALLLGTYLLNYMNFYVARVVTLSHHPWVMLGLAWYPWSLLRVVGFVATGLSLTVLGLHVVARWRKTRSVRPFPTRYLLMGLGFVVADIVVKALLAPVWRRLLYWALTGEALG